MPGPQIFVILTTFPIEKVNFCHFAYQGQWKCHFDPILTSFWALLSPTFWPWPKCAYCSPLSRRDLGGTLRDPNLTPNFDHFGPLWGSWRLQLGPIQTAFGLEDLLRTSQTHAWDPKFWSFWPLFLLKKVNFCHFAYQRSVKMPFWPYFDPFWALLSLTF